MMSPHLDDSSCGEKSFVLDLRLESVVDGFTYESSCQIEPSPEVSGDVDGGLIANQSLSLGAGCEPTSEEDATTRNSIIITSSSISSSRSRSSNDIRSQPASSHNSAVETNESLIGFEQPEGEASVATTTESASPTAAEASLKDNAASVDDVKDPSDAGLNLTLTSRLKRKKAVKIKRSKTGEGFKKLSFKRCTSLLDADRTTSESNLTGLDVRRSVAPDSDIRRLQVLDSEKVANSGGESDRDSAQSAAVSSYDSCFSPPIDRKVQGRFSLAEAPSGECFSPVDAVLADCFSPDETPRRDFFSPESIELRDSPQLFGISKLRMNGVVLDGGGDVARKDKGGGANPEPGNARHSLYQRQKSATGPFSSSDGANRDSTFLDSSGSKRAVVFRRKSSLVEEDRKPVTKRIFGGSKKTLQLLRKHSLASEYFTLKFDNEEEHMVAAIKGVSLGEAIADLLQRRGYNVDRTDVFLESSKTPLPLSSDSFLLANTVLWVKAKDDNRRNDSSLRSSASVSNLPSSSSSLDTLKEKKQVNGSVKNKKSVSSEESGGGIGFQDTSPFASLSRSDLPRYRGTSAGNLGTVGTPGSATPGTTASAKGHSKLQSLFSPFSKVQDKQEQLNELLTNYSLNGLPKMPDLLTLGRPHYDVHVFHLESHWTDIVREHHTQNKRQRDQQEAIWELLTTEVEYIHKLKVIMDLFMCCLFNLQNEQILNEIEADKLFSNIADVFYATCHFWTIHMSQVLKQARERREPLNPCLLKAGFLVFEKIFEPYTKYCLEQETCREYIKLKTKENELFRTFIMWAESQKQCNRLKLVDLIVKPFQRLTKYKLLLYAMRKPLDKMDSTTDVEEQKKDISTMIEQVENFVFKVNVAMRQRQDHKQLSQMIDRIESYDAIEAPSEECIKLVSKFCKLDLTCPVPGCSQQQMRILLLEGNLKLRDTYTKMDVYCFLFTDMLLITKPTAKRGERVRIIKPPMRLDKIVVHSLRDVASFMLLYLNEYHVAQAVYTFHGDSKLWLENVIKAQNDYKEKRNSFLMRTDVYDDVDDECAIYIEHASPADVNRQDSSSSADFFLPNCGVQRSTSCLEEQADDNLNQPDGSKTSSAFQTRGFVYRSQLSVPFSPFARNSSTESLIVDSKDGRYLTVPGEQNVDAANASEPEYATNDEQESSGESKFRTSLQRRGGRGERRYRTADTIQELKDPKHRNIQKRLSWSCSNAANAEDRAKMIGSESLRSVPSSSGVSSTVSLLVAGDGESRVDDDNNTSQSEARLSHVRSLSTVSGRGTKMKSVETQTDVSAWREVDAFNELVSPSRDRVEPFDDAKNQSMSKSLPNIAGLLKVNRAGEDAAYSEPEVIGDEPVASVPSTPRVFQKRRLSNSQSYGINQELMLFNSTLEASEV